MVDVLFAIIDFLKFLIPLALVLFVLAKILHPLRIRIEEKYELTWIKSTLVINLSIIFLMIFLTYLYFVFLGFSLANPLDAEMEYTAFEYVLMIGIALIRIVVATIILALVLLFFEFVASITTSLLKEKKYSPFVKEFLGVLVATTLFLVLLLFFFNWVPLGLFVYIFYGGISEAPLLSLIISL